MPFVGAMSESESNDHVSKFTFELFPDHSITMCLFEEVSNAAELRKEVMAQKFDAAFLDATMVC